MNPFIHLHTHSEKSFKDGCANFDSIINRAKENGQPGIALTDHGTMYDAMGFYLKAKKAGIKPIFGCEVYMIPEGKSASLRKSDEPDEDNKDDAVSYFHLVLLAKDYEGLVNLHTLVSLAGNKEDGHFYFKPRLYRKDLEKYSEGLICLSACLGGEVPKLISAGETSYAIKVAKQYQEIFGDDYYLELQDHGIEEQSNVNLILRKISKKLDIPLVLTNDCHYAKKEDYETHKLLKCISYKEDFYDAKNYDKYFPTDEFYIKDNDEMLSLAKEIGSIEAYKNTYKIFEKCNVVIDTSLHFPKADLSHPEKPNKKFKNANDKLKWLVEDLKSEKYDSDYRFGLDKVNLSINKEILDIAKGQFPDYFLNVYDIIKFAKDNEILIGAGRGSGAGSIVSNILNITDVDPIEYDLIWERFWNPGRCVFGYDDRIVKILDSDDIDNDEYLIQYEDDGETEVVKAIDIKILEASPPDLDIDVPSNRRDEVFEFTKRHFGYDKVANIITFGTYKGRNLVRDGAKALGMDDDVRDKILNAIPYKGTPSLSWCVENVDELIDLCNKDSEINDFVDKLVLIEGCSTNASTHAGGVVITDDVLYKYCPTFEGKNGLTTQYPYETLEAIGCLKIDLLGHTAEQVIDDACMLIKERHGIDINPYKIPNDDEKTYQLFRDIRMQGIPQLQADWVIPIIQDVQPAHIEDIIALVTMIRPGSLDSGQTEKYRNACKGIRVTPDVDELGPVVEKYNNCLLYQEQIMELARLLGGFTLEEADNLRKVCAKSKYKDKADIMLGMLADGMKKQKITSKNIERILEIVKAFFGYSFNKAHAAGYGITTYRVAYLKANYFLELTTAQLNAVIGDNETTAKFLDEVIEQGYEILSPDVNVSTDVWVCDDNGIRVPLGSINGVGPTCVDAIVEERELKGKYTSIENFVARLPGKQVRMNNIENLILTGGFDSFGFTRKYLWDESDNIVNTIRKNKTAKKGNALFGDDKKEIATTKKNSKMEEFPIKEMQEDETNLLGFIITMTDEEKALRLKRIQKRSAKLKGNSDSYTRKNDKKNTKKKSAIEKAKELNRLNNKAEEELSESDKKEVTNIKDNLKSKLNLKNKTIKNESKIEPIEVDSKELYIKIKDYKILPEKIFRILNKYKDGEYNLIFVIKTKDKNELNVYVDFTVNIDDKLIDNLKKYVGTDNVWIN